MPSELPLIPVNVRVVDIVKFADGTEEEIAYIKAMFELARDWWLEHASIELKLLNDEVELLVDADLSRPHDWRAPLDALAERTANWVTVALIQGRSVDTTLVADSGSETGGDGEGRTFFFLPSQEGWGYGCTIIEGKLTWGTLAHESGHAFGLPHGTKTPGSSKSDGEYCMAPFEDDTASLTDAEFRTNLMNTLTSGNVAFEDAWLTPNQVRRARLTIVSRTCGYAVLLSQAREGIPLMNDLAGDYLAQVWI